ncbi:5-oxoprolinase subunit PxpB [Burkholderia pseudomultivorans]|uniref:Allophanate hydrolase n=1 Tax=Burkholderia pseudomultivorans TaxID=1207504 RepID=A0A132EWZ4_9BURK|nr:5-oxoprolinase subunit PxpB [Burkholderia pseudomultivorans]EGD02519.1 allophanate hydrolase subunit 1 [Burkholderia sp. TJI49]AOI93605.1 allophanate hydrolase [Burkholderia pseudomultivorans]KVC26374.1 allophanate hydrolase [Burkholderia pseudomultivorans]KVC36232.1 allophanate hydrolase [Burkholderia pseudomultivorans]KVC44286.1 allophanate hydrolase [Burkholderia pseudomultivorans]
MTQPRIYPLGDTALVCEVPPPATLDCQRRVWAVAEAARAWPDVVDVVPGMNNLTIVFDALATTAESLTPLLHDAWQTADVEHADGRDVEIPVVYGGANGPDLAAVAAHTGLSADEVVARHAAGEYVVFFVGFQPGFAYLGGLDASLHTPRRAAPRLEVPAGSVGIGGAQTGLYPTTSPGGWQLIGRTSQVLFDPTRQPPTLLLPGDRVRFTIAGVDAT